tara:strand:+ start:4611 stop:5252 length:642 start_codon:yes stop_codon:yes gene_type:complete
MVAGRDEPTGDTGGAYGLLTEAYRRYVNPRAKAAITAKARAKIDARLKRYTPEELTVAIHNFGEDEWNMRNNRHRGLAWFMNGDDRIEEFLNLDLKTVAEAEERANACPECGSEKFGFRGTVWHCESCQYTQQGRPPDSDRRGQGIGNGMGLLGGASRFAPERLAGVEPRPQRRIAGSTRQGDGSACPRALSPPVSGNGQPARHDYDPQTGGQ